MVDCSKDKEILITAGVTSITEEPSDVWHPVIMRKRIPHALFHVQDTILKVCTNCLVCTVDPDVAVILIGKFHHLVTLCQGVTIWVASVQASLT